MEPGPAILTMCTASAHVYCDRGPKSVTEFPIARSVNQDFSLSLLKGTISISLEINGGSIFNLTWNKARVAFKEYGACSLRPIGSTSCSKSRASSRSTYVDTCSAGRQVCHSRRGAGRTRRRHKRTSEIHCKGDDADADGLHRNPAARKPVWVRARHRQQ